MIMAYTFLLRDVPALASCSNSSHTIACRLYIKYSQQHNQAAIVINLSVFTHASDDPQEFDLTYNADDLADGTFLGPVPSEVELTHDDLSKIARRTKATAIKVLLLTLRTPCSVRCAPMTACFAPKPGHAAAFRTLRNLASSTEVQIMFDHNWVQARHYAALHTLINRPDTLAGIPASVYQGPLSRQVDWTVFGPVYEDNTEEPPGYEGNTAKRPRPSEQGPTVFLWLESRALIFV